MANRCKNTIAVIGLQVAPDIFVRELLKALFGLDLDNFDPTMWGETAGVDGKTWYGSLVEEYRREGPYAARFCILYPGEPYDKLGVTVPQYYCETKWATPIEAIRKASKQYPGLTFDVSWWVLQDGPAGEYVIRDGKLLEVTERRASGYLFDPLLFPSVSLISAHLPFTLAQHATARLDDAIAFVRGLIGVLEDERFVNSPCTPYSDVRDQDKTAKVHARLTALLETMTHQVANIDFTNVLLEREDLPAAYARSLESTRQLMTDLGLDSLLPAEGEALRFAILSPPVAIVSDPYRAIVPVVCYLNADPAGKYDRSRDADGFAIEWDIRYACLTRFDLTQIHKLPEDNETLGDIDIIMVRAPEHSIGHEFHRASTARWRQDPGTAKAVEKAALVAANVLAAALESRPNATIFTDSKAAESAIHESAQKLRKWSSGMTQTMEHGNDDDRLYFTIRIIGEKSDIALAERDLAGGFGSCWNSRSITTEPDGVTYHVWHSWENAGIADQVENVFHAHRTLIFLMSIWAPDEKVRWNVVRAYGFDAEVTAGEYEPSGGTPYEESQLFRDIFGRYLDLSTRPTPAQVQAEFGAKTEKFRAMRERRLENQSTSKVPDVKRKPKRKPPR